MIFHIDLETAVIEVNSTGSGINPTPLTSFTTWGNSAKLSETVFLCKMQGVTIKC